MKWLPIEIAPKDGTLVLGYWKQMKTDNECYGLTKWSGNSWESEDEARDYRNPTHWMPLPNPPEES